MKKNILSFILVSLLAAAILQGCLKDKGLIPTPPETYCDSLNVSYNMDVVPIVAAKCAIPGCHDASGGAPGDFTSYTNLSGVSHTVSVRIQLPTTNSQHMPQIGFLTPEELDILLCWIENGAQNN